MNQKDCGPPTDCPYHDLPPDQEVTVFHDDVVFQRSASLLCESWHVFNALRPALNAIAAAVNTKLKDEAV